MIRWLFDLFNFFENRDQHIKNWVFDYLKTMFNILEANIRTLASSFVWVQIFTKGLKKGANELKIWKKSEKILSWFAKSVPAIDRQL